MKKLATWNVNGIRACFKNGFMKWLEQEDPDIVCLQETKAHPDQFPAELTQLKNYFSFHATAKKPGYSGVSIFSKIKPKEILVGLDEKKFDDEGRTLTLFFDDWILINTYVPNAGRDHERLDFKMEYSHLLLETLLSYHHAGEKVLLCGDLNTAHRPIDLANPLSNKNSSGFLPVERAFHDLLEEKGLIDLFRHRHPDLTGAYTWWTYRGDCRDRNIGWRIDYWLGNQSSQEKVHQIYHRPQVRGSDHCPVIVEISTDSF